ncbi:glycosyltransferase family protein [Chromatiaceae bacterium AAb-1]|nr:glycosyltransferase family protein [Chromatiaceae bacterium AAb-1]
MKILYGVQATGNGHISRARAMEKHFSAAGVQVDYLFSGRPADQFFDMQPFKEYQVKRGLTFVTEAGKVNYSKTLFQASIRELWRDIQQLDCSGYDLIITDFEPITAWAARRQRKTAVAIGHQYAFGYGIPMKQANWISKLIFKYFAPADFQLGLHWHHFNYPILPPILDLESETPPIQNNKVLVYLPFEDQQQVIQWLRPLTEYHFCIYGPGLPAEKHGHITTHPPALQAFKHDLHSCQFVLSNAGFELISEALQLQKAIMVKPLQGQMEQLSNALALQQLNFASSTGHLTTAIIANWLSAPQTHQRIAYPDVAAAICHWLLHDRPVSVGQLSRSLWQPG